MADTNDATSPTAAPSAGTDPVGWTRRDGALHILFQTGDFVTGLNLVNAIGAAAEAANHHPDITLTYPTVALRLLSHDVAAITERDTALAEQINGIAAALEIAPTTE